MGEALRSFQSVFAAYKRRLPHRISGNGRNQLPSYSLVTILNTPSIDDKRARTRLFYEADMPLSIYITLANDIPTNLPLVSSYDVCPSQLRVSTGGVGSILAAILF